MSCEAYREALIDAAGGGDFPSVVRQHLAACASCRSAFEREESLLSAIDARVRDVVNSEIPATLIPRVHVALNNEQGPQTNLQRWILAGTAFTSALIVVFILQWNQHSKPVPVKIATVQTTPPTSRQCEASQQAEPPATGQLPRQAKRTEVAQVLPKAEPAQFTAEVLVPDEERVAFAQFVTRTSPTGASVSAGTALVPKAPQEAVEIAPVEIASLELKPLGEKDSGPAKF